MAKASEQKGGVHVELEDAKVKSVQLKDGMAQITVAANVGDLKATRKDLDKLAHESFKGFVVIEGAVVEQESLPGFEDEGGDDDAGE